MPRLERRQNLSGRFAKESRTSRIQMGQPAFRPLHVASRRFVKRTKYQPNPSWWILHRRGILRPRVGVDPLEARAISHDLVKGTLPERIVYQFLLRMGMVEGIDWSFQTSEDGGRLEMGGIVVDFLFIGRHLILQVQGPTHTEWLRGKKDLEQYMLLTAMGYDVVYLTQEEIYNEAVFEDKMRQIFGLSGIAGAGGVQGQYETPEDGQWETIYGVLQRVDELYGEFSRALSVARGGL